MSSELNRPISATVIAAAALDAVLIVVFAAIGRASHSESHPVLDAGVVAWPFLAGAAIGWLLVVRLRWAPASLRAGIPIWLGCVAIGMVLRSLTGRGIAVSFVIVATIVLGLFLLGWRAIPTAWKRRSRK